MDIEIKELDYHRNGISGEGFFACRFVAPGDNGPQNMFAVVFPPENEDWEVYERGEWDNPRVAVFDEDVLPTISFGFNSWRGDHYAPALYSAIKQWNDDWPKRHKEMIEAIKKGRP
jgi:hypothetical protein